MHCPFCSERHLKKHQRTGLRVCPRHGFVGPRPLLEATRRGITLAQWQSIHAQVLSAGPGKGAAFYRKLENTLTTAIGGRPQ